MEVQTLLGHCADSEDISSCLAKLSGKDSTPKHELKAYSDAVYCNYLTLGLSLLFSPIGGYKPKAGALESDMSLSKLSLTGIDIYNRIETTADPKDNKSGTPQPKIVNAQYSPYPAYPITLNLPSPSTKNVSPSPEKTGNEARGLQAWERGRDARWSVITIFEPSDAKT